MTGILAKVVVNAIAIWVAALVIGPVRLDGGGTARTIGSYLVVGAIFGLVNTVIKPIVKFFAFPFIVLTLGLLSFVINALMLEIVDWASNSIGINFDSGPFFWSTLGAAVIITFVSMILSVLVPDDTD
ncbi:MAG: phage holin family protein [Kineosporiaceae bacterium]